MSVIDIPRQRSDRDIQSMFSDNLRLLMQDQPSVTKVCKQLQINRTQFNRYLSGEVSPRPVILSRICEYFGVDGRILLEPIAGTRASGRSNTMMLYDKLFSHTLEPVPHSVLPDGLYGKWKVSIYDPGYVTFHILRVYTENHVRRTRMKTNVHHQSVIKGLKSAKQPIDDLGIAFRQLNGFAVVDWTRDSQLQGFASFRAGYSYNSMIFTGIKVIGATLVPHLTHSCSVCVMEPLPTTTPELLRAVRVKRTQRIDQVPDHVRNILLEISHTGFMSEMHKLWPPELKLGT